MYQPVTTPCILSTYEPNSDGYALLYVKTAGGKRVSVKHHRIAYAEAHKMSLEDMKHLVVMHKCDVRNCINPDHLMLGTVAMNNQDKQNKGRNITHFTAGNNYQKLGTGNARLTAEQVRAIRVDGRRQVDIAKAYRITQVCVSNIKLRKSWADLE